MSESYKKVEVLSYVKEGIESGVLVPIVAEKFARIIARQGVVGERVVTMSVNEKGEPIEEEVAFVPFDKKTGRAGWVVCKADENGNPVVDEHGNKNFWIIDDSTFRRKYEVEDGELGVYRPVGGPQIFVQFYENLVIDQWGGEEKIAAGGYINITDLNDIYGISERDFNDTYKITSKKAKVKIQ